MAKGTVKMAQDPSATVRTEASTSPVPTPVVATELATAGKKGPIGTSPRTNYSRVNSGAPPVPDAGAVEQKSLQPKYGSNMSAMQSASRPSLHEMVKNAQSGVLSRTRIAEEAARQQAAFDAEKTAGKVCEKCGKENCSCEKKASAETVSSSYATKVAEALTYIAEELTKSAAPNMPPPHISEHHQEVGKGPGALEVSQATASTPLPDHKGQAHQTVPMQTPLERANIHDPKNSVETNMGHPTHGVTPQKTVGGSKHAAALLESNLRFMKEAGNPAALAAAGIKRVPIAPPRPGMKTLTAPTTVPRPAPKMDTKTASLLEANLAHLGLVKKAEDAINPAHISAGPAVPPEASEAGQPAKPPAGGKPQGDRHLVGSNEAAINYTKGQAKSDPKSDMKKWLDEPALTSQTDSTLRVSLDNASRAGTKFASIKPEDHVKTAAARALLEKLYEMAKDSSAA